MKKTILFIMAYIIFFSIISCDNMGLLEKDNDVKLFSDDKYSDPYGRNIAYNITDSNKFVNITEIYIKTKEEAIQLAKNETIWKYNNINIFYDDVKSVWCVEFSLDNLYSQYVYINKNGTTQRISFSVKPFVYDINYDDLEHQYGYKSVNPNKFKNTMETEIKTKEDIIKLAKSEVIWEYNMVEIRYDGIKSIWCVEFSLDILYGQYVYINDKGITIEISCFIQFFDDNVVPNTFNMHIDELELYYGGIQRNPNDFKNIMESEIKTKEEAVELAKNEVIKKYDQVFISYDSEQYMWGIVFWAEEKPYGGQYIFIDSKGITQAIIDTTFMCDYVEYIEYLEEQGGVKRNSKEFKNKIKNEFSGGENLREEIINLAKNELKDGNEYDKISVYLNRSTFVVSFWVNGTTKRSQHIFMEMEGITRVIYDIE